MILSSDDLNRKDDDISYFYLTSSMAIINTNYYGYVCEFWMLD